MKVLILSHAGPVEGEIDDPADCVVGNRATVRVLPVTDPPEYVAGVIAEVFEDAPA